jgi:hypothetical protein
VRGKRRDVVAGDGALAYLVVAPPLGVFCVGVRPARRTLGLALHDALGDCRVRAVHRVARGRGGTRNARFGAVHGARTADGKGGFVGGGDGDGASEDAAGTRACVTWTRGVSWTNQRCARQWLEVCSAC